MSNGTSSLLQLALRSQTPLLRTLSSYTNSAHTGWCYMDNIHACTQGKENTESPMAKNEAPAFLARGCGSARCQPQYRPRVPDSGSRILDLGFVP